MGPLVYGAGHDRPWFGWSLVPVVQLSVGAAVRGAGFERFYLESCSSILIRAAGVRTFLAKSP
jgi:hypothetical protein